MRSFLRVSLTAVLLCAPTSLVSAQRRTTILVETGDAVSGIFLPSVQVQIASLKLTQHTDSLGEARLTGVPPGRYTIDARRVGFQPLSAPVLIAGQDSIEVVLLMRATVAQLDTVLVSKPRIPMALREFESRRERGLGQFVTGVQIDSEPGASLAAIVETHLRGVRVVTDAVAGTHIVTLRPATEGVLVGRGGGLCQPLVYLDGVLLADDTGFGPDLSIIDVVSIGGIEFYEPSEIPVQYRGTGAMQNTRIAGATGAQASGSGVRGRGGSQSQSKGGATSPSCGAVLIWSKPP